MDARALVEKFVDAFGDGRLQDALGLLHDEFVVHAAGDVPYSGDYRGAEGFSELIAKIMAVLELTPSPDMQYIADGDKVVLYYRLTFTSRTSGNSVEMDVSPMYGTERAYTCTVRRFMDRLKRRPDLQVLDLPLGPGLTLVRKAELPAA